MHCSRKYYGLCYDDSHSTCLHRVVVWCLDWRRNLLEFTVLSSLIDLKKESSKWRQEVGLLHIVPLIVDLLFPLTDMLYHVAVEIDPECLI